MEFKEICNQDFEQFREIAARFQKVLPEDANELYDLSKKSWILATRWSEIQSMARKIADTYGINKTDFGTWAYQIYRQLQEMHITTRSWYRLAVEELKNAE